MNVKNIWMTYNNDASFVSFMILRETCNPRGNLKMTLCVYKPLVVFLQLFQINLF